MKNRKFTLIELMMVILVIAIILSLLFPSFGRAYHLAKHAKCISGQKQYYTTLVLYSKNNKSSTPVFTPDWTASQTSFLWDMHKSFFTALMLYTPGNDVFHCSYVNTTKHAFNNPADTCAGQTGAPNKLGLASCKSLYFWGNSVPLGHNLDGRPLRGSAHSSPIIPTNQYYAYDQPRSFDLIKPSQPLISDAYYSYSKNGNTSFTTTRIHRYNGNNLFGQINGDGAGKTATEAKLYKLKVNDSTLPSTAAFYGIP